MANIGIKHLGKNDALDCKDCNKQVTRESDLKIHEILLPQSSIFIVTNVTNDSYPNVQWIYMYRQCIQIQKEIWSTNVWFLKCQKMFLSKGHMDGKTRQNGSWKNQELQMWKLR